MRKNPYPVATPEELGVSSEAITRTISEIRETHGLELHSFLMLRKGRLIREEYFREGESSRLHVLHSVSKSFCSTALGMAQAQGLLSLEDKLYDFFPEHADLCDSDYKRGVTVAHLLMMGSGFENNEQELFGQATFGDIVKAALSQKIIHKPGTVFDYYTLGTYLTSAVFSRVCPQGIHSYLRGKLFAPMGFGETHWNTDSQNIPMGGFGLYMTAYDMTRLGQLYLQKGKWEGQLLLPEEYVTAASSAQISNANHASGNRDWTAGYGYQFWRNSFGGFRADGMFGQYIIVLPEKETVIVMTSHLDDMQKPLSAIEEILLAGM
ncbi:MAG: beta-lactamase family protein [Oscillospiraceae bacterium]|nr:beta-lactamase family protein [Oscillospiraceae bacterium]